MTKVDKSSSSDPPSASLNTGTSETIENSNESHIPHNEDLPKWRLYLLTFSLGMGSLLAALDTSILGPAIPAITSEFHTLEHIGWYTSAYLLTLMPFQLVFGRLIAFYEPKLFYMTSLLVFEVGSVLCAAAPNSPVFILGRAVAGLGAAGTTAGGFAIIGHTPMRERPRLMAFFFALQSIAYTAGPTMSGALTDSYLTWRFNFWVNLPLGFVALVTLHFVVHKVPSSKGHLPVLTKLRSCDPVSAGLLVAWLVLLFLALEWGGNALPYSSPQVWGCLLGSGLLAVAFAILQVMKKDNGLVPFRLVKQRTVACCCIFSSLYGAANITHITLLPTYLQTVHGVSATMSGVYQLAITVSNNLAITLSGLAISHWGHILPFLCSGPLVYLVGAVLFQQLHTTTSRPALYVVGSEVPIGAGFGLAIHSSLLAIQLAVSAEDMPVAAVMEIFSQQLGRAVGISIAQSVFVLTLQRGLSSLQAEQQDDLLLEIAGQGLEQVVDSMQALDPARRDAVREVLNTAVTTAFILPVAATAAAAVVTWFVEKRTIDVSKKAKAASAEAGGDSPADQGIIHSRGEDDDGGRLEAGSDPEKAGGTAGDASTTPKVVGGSNDSPADGSNGRASMRRNFTGASPPEDNMDGNGGGGGDDAGRGLRLCAELK